MANFENDSNVSKVYVGATIKKSIGPYENVELNVGITLPVDSIELTDLEAKIDESYKLVEKELVQKIESLKKVTAQPVNQTGKLPVKRFEDTVF